MDQRGTGTMNAGKATTEGALSSGGASSFVREAVHLIEFVFLIIGVLFHHKLIEALKNAIEILKNVIEVIKTLVPLAERLVSLLETRHHDQSLAASGTGGVATPASPAPAPAIIEKSSLLLPPPARVAGVSRQLNTEPPPRVEQQSQVAGRKPPAKAAKAKRTKRIASQKKQVIAIARMEPPKHETVPENISLSGKASSSKIQLEQAHDSHIELEREVTAMERELDEIERELEDKRRMQRPKKRPPLLLWDERVPDHGISLRMNSPTNVIPDQGVPSRMPSEGYSKLDVCKDLAQYVRALQYLADQLNRRQLAEKVPTATMAPFLTKHVDRAERIRALQSLAKQLPAPNLADHG